MAGDPTRDVRVDDEQLNFIIEGLEMLRIYTQGFIDAEGRMKLRDVERLETRLRLRLTHRRKGYTGNYAEKL